MSRMQVYRVGGVVRDGLLGLASTDTDYVVVGATPEQMVAAGYRPVGKDFPVFLHPETQEEYALARTERKSGRGYTGFTVYAAPEVTLEQDLARRDLTINAMALDADHRLIDPFGGAADLRAGVLRHVGPAFVEDPVRILRVARFAARYGFAVAPETMALMRDMVAAGEVDFLVAERVWQELSKGLMEARPARLFQVLRECGALARLVPELDRLFGVPQDPEHHPEVDTGVHVLLVLDQAAQAGASLAVRFAALTHDLGKGTTPTADWPRHPEHELRGLGLVDALCSRLKVPADCRDLARLAVRWHGQVHRALHLDAAGLYEVLAACDVWRRPARLDDLLAVCQADSWGRPGFAGQPYLQTERLRAARAAVLAVDAAAIAREAGPDPAAIPLRLRAAREAALRQLLLTLEDETKP